MNMFALGPSLFKLDADMFFAEKVKMPAENGANNESKCSTGTTGLSSSGDGGVDVHLNGTPAPSTATSISSNIAVRAL